MTQHYMVSEVGVEKMYRVRQGQKHSTLASVQTPIGQGLPSPVTIMFNRQVQGIMPVVD